MVAESNHLRCTDETSKHINYHRKQGFADGELDVKSTTSTRSEDVAKDLSGKLITSFCASYKADFAVNSYLKLKIKRYKIYKNKLNHFLRILVKITMSVSYHPSATKSLKQ